MQKPQQREGEFFASLRRETPIEIAVRTASLALANVHDELVELTSTGRIPETPSESPARHFRKGCPTLRTLCTEFKIFEDELIKLGPENVPALLFSKLSQAFHWTTKAVRHYLDRYEPTSDPSSAADTTFDEIKALCRPDTQPDGLDAATFTDELRRKFKTLLDAALQIAQLIQVTEEKRAVERDRAAGRRHRKLLPQGKGFSHFTRIGEEYKGVRLADATHLHLFGTCLEITGQANWNMIDGWLAAHFADRPFEVTTKELEKLTTADEKKLRTYVHQETLEEVGRRRERNRRYTGRAWFVESAAG